MQVSSWHRLRDGCGRGATRRPYLHPLELQQIVIAIAALPDLLEQLVEVVASGALADADDGRVGRLALRLDVGLQPGHALLVLQALLAALRGVEHEVGDVLPVRGVLLHVFGFLSIANPQTYARPSASIPRTEMPASRRLRQCGALLTLMMDSVF